MLDGEKKVSGVPNDPQASSTLAALTSQTPAYTAAGSARARGRTCAADDRNVRLRARDSPKSAIFTRHLSSIRISAGRRAGGPSGREGWQTHWCGRAGTVLAPLDMAYASWAGSERGGAGAHSAT